MERAKLMARQTSPHIVTLLDDVEKCEKEIVESLLALPDRRHVHFIINSGGGSVYASLGIATVIKMKRFQAEATVLADCSSSALMVFATCQVRRVAAHASFLFHPMKWSSEDQSRLAGAESWSTEFARVSKVSEDWLVENLGIKRVTLRKWVREERYVKAKEMVDLGLAEFLDLTDDNVVDISRDRKRRVRRKSVAQKQDRVRKVG